MKEAGLESKQPGMHRYRTARSGRPDILKLFASEFDAQQSNQVWSGNIISVWVGERRNYLSTVLDLFARRVVG